jgi:hypothetical protein
LFILYLQETNDDKKEKNPTQQQPSLFPKYPWVEKHLPSKLRHLPYSLISVKKNENIQTIFNYLIQQLVAPQTLTIHPLNENFLTLPTPPSVEEEKKDEVVEANTSTHKKPRKVYLCGYCGQPKKGHNCPINDV